MGDDLFRVECKRTVKQTILTNLIRNSSESAGRAEGRVPGNKNKAGRKKPQGIKHISGI